MAYSPPPGGRRPPMLITAECAERRGNRHPSVKHSWKLPNVDLPILLADDVVDENGNPIDKYRGSDNVELVPVTVDLELENDLGSVRDVFLWNKNEEGLDPTVFAELLRRDLLLPKRTATGEQLTNSIREAIDDACNKHVIHPYSQPEGYDVRVVITLDVLNGDELLHDRFEWDLTAGENDVESFVKLYCKELGLGVTWPTLIAHAIRKQIHVHTKLLNGVNLLRGEDVERGIREAIVIESSADDVQEQDSLQKSKAPDETGDSSEPRQKTNTRSEGVPNRNTHNLVASVVRKKTEVKNWQPTITTLTPQELEQRVVEQSGRSGRRRQKVVYRDNRGYKT
eukprot:Clim_evm15s14 gene=Clim_evmTU15s14